MDFLSELGLIFKSPPYSTIFVIMVSLGVSTFSTLLSRRLMDVDKLKRYTRETKEYNSLKMKGLKSQDRRLLKKIEDNKPRADKMQKELFSMRMKPMMYTIIPLMLVFVLMNGYFGANDSIVAIIPYNLWDTFVIIPIKHTGLNQDALALIPSGFFVPNYIGWYFFTSITFGSVIQKLAGLTPD
ncbi:MAG: EMC3/TMCO1 family protein [Candidatus Hodarchaeales archaeon]|jgi:uncharacterized membrane protein (DUF106 family)